MPRRNLAPLLALCVCSSVAYADESQPAAGISADAIRTHVEFLADDLLEGRAAGARGYDIAAAYVAAQFRLYGLRPAGDEGAYLQHFDLVQGKSIDEASSLVLRRDGRQTALAVREDFLPWDNPLAEEGVVEAPMAFAGYGITAPELGFDDLGLVDLEGKIAVVLSGAPAKFPNSQRAFYSSSRLKYARLKAAGAVGIIAISTRVDQDRVPWERRLSYTWRPSMAWRGEDGRTNLDPVAFIAGVSVRTPAIAPFFEGAPLSLEEVLDAADAGEPVAFDLPGTVEIRVRSELANARSSNVLAILPGSDPALMNEHLIITAHLDGVGVGQPVDGDAIYNGAWDNATGIGILLEIARVMSQAAPPRRSVIFAAVGAEEHGLLGSDYFAEYPTVPLESIVANVNIDMPYVAVPTTDFVAFGAEHTTLGPAAREAARAEGYTLSPDPIPEEVIFVRSDQFSFIRRGIPAIYIDGGYTPVDPSHDVKALTKAFLQSDYHGPTDDVRQPIPYETLAGLGRINTRLLIETANSDDRVAWKDRDFFGETFERQLAAP
jgi:hypothetical protein